MNTVTWRRIVSVMLILGLIFACIVAYILVMTTREQPLPFRYDDITMPGTYQRTLCPGDALQFDIRITVEDAPTVVAVVSNWQGPAGAMATDKISYFIQEEAKVVTSTQTVDIPTNLQPGAWVYERAASVNTVSHPALLQVPFEIQPRCAES